MRAPTVELYASEQKYENADSARAQLARLTKNVHDALHHQPGFTRLMSQISTMREYRCLLGRLYGFYASLESALGDNTGLISDIDMVARAKSPLLLADLVSLGMSRLEIDLMEKCPYAPRVRSPDEIIGALYVVEGAGLGGKIIARKLNYLFGDDLPAGRQFFLGRPVPDPLPWVNFCSVLEHQAATGSLATIAESALHTFEALELWLNAGNRDV